MANLLVVGTTYHFRIIIPADLQPFLQRSAIKFSLRTGVHKSACELAMLYKLQCLQVFRTIRNMKTPEELREAQDSVAQMLKKASEAKKLAGEGRLTNFELGQLPNGLPFIKSALPGEDMANAVQAHQMALEGYQMAPSHQPMMVANATASSHPTMKLSEAVSWWQTKQQEANPITTKKYVKYLLDFLAFKTDCDVHTIERHHLDSYRTFIINQYQNSLPTQKNKFSVLGQLFDQLKKAGYYTKENPATGQVAYKTRDKRKRAKENGKSVFTDEHLAKIFDPENYKLNTSPSEYWVPLIQLFTGARVNEICQLRLKDIIEVEGIPCIHINDGALDQSIKTISSERIIPIHPTLLELGFSDYIKNLKSDNGQAFPHLKNGANRFGGRQIKAFTLYLQKLGFTTDGKLGSHSFRKTVIQKLQDHNIEQSKRMQFVGHMDQSVHATNYERKQKAIEFYRDVVPYLDYGIDFKKLKR